MEVYWIMKKVWGTITRIFWVGRVEGRRNVPKSGGVIIAPNHQSWLDFSFLATVLKRRLYFLVGEFAYKVKVSAWALKRMGHIKVDRNAPDKSFVYAEAKKILDSGQALVVFPEGRMTRTGKLQGAYLGVAKMALASKVPIVPVVIESYHVYSIHHKWPRLNKRCRIKFLEPIPYKKIRGKSPSHIVHELLMPMIASELKHDYEHRHLSEETTGA
jgi:1-acyl-sn-glycerol-3-phosphate acyltransferase